MADKIRVTSLMTIEDNACAISRPRANANQSRVFKNVTDLDGHEVNGPHHSYTRWPRTALPCRSSEIDSRNVGMSGVGSVQVNLNADLPTYDADDLDDLEDAPDAEVEEAEEKVVDQASAARTIAELQTEIAMLQRLEAAAHKVRQSNADRKWDELSRLLQNRSEMFDAEGHRRKLVIFTEHRDTLNYLAERIAGLLGKREAVVTLHGGMGREERKKAQEGFTQDKDVEILIATDAAGEGINLQRAHLSLDALRHLPRADAPASVDRPPGCHFRPALPRH
jgi:hypothetical protein